MTRDLDKLCTPPDVLELVRNAPQVWHESGARNAPAK